MINNFINQTLLLVPLHKSIFIGVLIIGTFLLIRKGVIKIKRRYRRVKYLAKKSIKRFLIALLFGL